MIRRRLLLLLSLMLTTLCVDAQRVTSYERPDAKEFRAAVKEVLSRTECTASEMENRIKAMDIIQREFNNFSSQQWRDYNALRDKKSIAAAEKEGTLYFYRKAMDKVLKEVKRTKVAPGHIVMWNLYNMGYIVKTPSHTFSIDLIHKHIDKFAKCLDFNLITHKHKDHGSPNEFQAFAAAGVPVYDGHKRTNLPENLDWRYVEEGESIRFGKISINTRRTDHSRKPDGHKIVTTFEIDCGDDADNIVIFHTGDCRNYEQLNPEKPVDFFIFHSAVGLDIQSAINKIQPRFAVFSHGWEMGHSVTKFRWTIDDLVAVSKSIKDFPDERKLIPSWGERIGYPHK